MIHYFADFDGLRQRVLQDIAQGQFQPVRVIEPHYQEAERLFAASRRRHFRTLDALQLAVAVDLHRRRMIDRVVYADTLLCEIARKEGLAVVNPARESPFSIEPQALCHHGIRTKHPGRAVAVGAEDVVDAAEALVVAEEGVDEMPPRVFQERARRACTGMPRSSALRPEVGVEELL